MTDKGKFTLQRNLGVVSFIAVLLSAIIIFFYFRAQTIHNLKEMSERSYSAVALSITGSVNDHFNQYLHEVENQSTTDLGRTITQHDLQIALYRLIKDTPIVRAKIYDHSGRVVYSTKTEQIGKLQADNQGFITAISGRTATKLIYRDTFNVFDGELENANLTQSYVPIWNDSRSSPLGVFEIYADVNDLVVEAEGNVVAVFLTVLMVMSSLFLALMINIKKAETIIEQQRKDAGEKQKTLEILSAKMITAQEDEKKRIAFALHEDIVQSMTAVKMHLEKCVVSAKNADPNKPLGVPEHIVPILQDAIQKIRAVSMDLRPRSLDDFGLKAATKSLIADCLTVEKPLKFGAYINITEDSLSSEKKAIIYRIIKDTLNVLCYENQFEGTVNIHLNLEDGHLVLKIEIDREENEIESAIAEQSSLAENDFEKMRERTILSGGDFHLANMSSWITVAQSVWA